MRRHMLRRMLYEAHNIVAAIETDLGVGPVCGFGFSGSAEARVASRIVRTTKQCF